MRHVKALSINGEAERSLVSACRIELVQFWSVLRGFRFRALEVCIGIAEVALNVFVIISVLIMFPVSVPIAGFLRRNYYRGLASKFGARTYRRRFGVWVRVQE